MCTRVTPFGRKGGRTSDCFVNVLFMARSSILIRSYGRMLLSRTCTHACTCIYFSLLKEQQRVLYDSDDLLYNEKRFIKQFEIFNKLFRKILYKKIHFVHFIDNIHAIILRFFFIVTCSLLCFLSSS